MKSVENILGYIREAVSLEKIFEIVQENTEGSCLMRLLVLEKIRISQIGQK